MGFRHFPKSFFFLVWAGEAPPAGKMPWDDIFLGLFFFLVWALAPSVGEMPWGKFLSLFFLVWALTPPPPPPPINQALNAFNTKFQCQ